MKQGVGWIGKVVKNHLPAWPLAEPDSISKGQKFSYWGSSAVKNRPANAGDIGSIPGPERSPGEGSPLQDSCLENPMDRGAWRRVEHNLAAKQ